MAGPGTQEPESPSLPRLSRRWKIVFSLLMAGFLVLGIAIGRYLPILPPASSGSPSPSGCLGQVVLRGNVTDQAGLPLAGVVVSLSSRSGGGLEAVATTTATGEWQALVSARCPYAASYYWQSAQDGPLLATVTNVSGSSDYRAPVADQPIDLLLFAENSNALNVTISAELPAGVVFGVPAVVSGNISTGFLPAVGGGTRGWNFTLPGPVNLTARSPLGLVYQAAMAYRVQDEAGDWVVYVTPGYGGSSLSFLQENMTPDQAAGLAYLQGRSPFYEVTGSSTGQLLATFTGASAGSFESTSGILGVPIASYLTVPAGRSAKVAASFVNSGPGNAWFIVYQGGADFYTWYCGAGPSPPACL